MRIMPSDSDGTMKMLKLVLKCVSDTRNANTVPATIPRRSHLFQEDSLDRMHAVSFRHASHICTSREELTHGKVLSMSHRAPSCSRCGAELRRSPVENVVLAQLRMHPLELQATSNDS